MVFTRLFSPLCGSSNRLLVVAIVTGFVFCCLGKMTTAHPVTGVVGKTTATAKTTATTTTSTATTTASGRHHDQVSERQRRTADQTRCAQPSDLATMFNNINRTLAGTQFLKDVGDRVYDVTTGTSFEAPTFKQSPICPPPFSAANESLCPFDFGTLSFPPGYYPRSLEVARCLCPARRNVTRLRRSCTCKEITRQVIVLRPAGCFEGLQKYEEQQVPVTVGCRCISIQ